MNDDTMWRQAITAHESEIATARRAHNSKLAVNRVNADILYSIFVLAVYDSTPPIDTTLKISHVCDHWRKSVLGWPALWAFVDLNTTARAISILDLFLNRSGNAPLTLSRTDWHQYRGILIDYIESKANVMVPRLCSLTLHLKDYELAQIHHVFRNSTEPALRLRHLDIRVYQASLADKIAFPSLGEFLQVNLSYLRVLKLEASDLPWVELPHTKLTHFKLSCPPNPPALSQLLCLLDRCPLLCDLEFHISDSKDVKVDIAAATTRLITRLDFPDLRQLVLKSEGPSSYSYIRELSTRISTATSLSKFCLLYDHHPRPGYRQFQSTTNATPLSIFEAIPSGVLSCFANHCYLYIRIDFEAGSFRISSAPHRIRSGYPFDVSGSFPSGPTSFDHITPILDLIHSMPRITQLELGSRHYSTQTWEVPWVIDIPNSFPCLDTLGLEFWFNRWWRRVDIHPALNSLPAGLKLKKLILTDAFLSSRSVDALLQAVSRTEVEILELCGHFPHRKAVKDVTAALREKGVVVVQSK